MTDMSAPSRSKEGADLRWDANYPAAAFGYTWDAGCGWYLSVSDGLEDGTDAMRTARKSAAPDNSGSGWPLRRGQYCKEREKHGRRCILRELMKA